MSETKAGSYDTSANLQTIVKLGFTAILLGYLLAWLPHDVAGLSFIGVEMGEWVKFLPQVRSGQIAADRNLFYLPPITLGLMLVLWTVGWPNRRWQTWAMRAVAVFVALLAFPAFEAILDESTDQWLGRVLMIVFVALVATFVPLLKRLSCEASHKVGWAAILFLAVMGLALPTWAYLAIRPAVTNLFAAEVGFGPGFWLNGVGHLLVAGVALYWLFKRPLAYRDHVL